MSEPCSDTILGFPYWSLATPNKLRANPEELLSGPSPEFPGVLWSSLKFVGILWSSLLSLVVRFPFVSFGFSPLYLDFYVFHLDLLVICFGLFVVYSDLLWTFVYVTLSLCHLSPFDMSPRPLLFQPFPETPLYVLA